MNPDYMLAAVKSVELFFLVFLRVTGMLAVSPVFGRQNLPAYYKVGFSFFLALIMTGTQTIVMPAALGVSPDGFGAAAGYAYYAIREFTAGAIIGFVPYLMFSAIYLAGQMIDMKIGFSMVNVLDPVSNIQVPITSNFYYIVCMLMFFTANAHHSLILAICRSYEVIPLGHINVDGEVVESVLRLFSGVFAVGFSIAAPIIFTVLLADVALGIISKAMPQINVFMVGMPLKILVGVFMMIVTIPAMIAALNGLFGNVGGETVSMMRRLGRQ